MIIHVYFDLISHNLILIIAHLFKNPFIGLFTKYYVFALLYLYHTNFISLLFL